MLHLVNSIIVATPDAFALPHCSATSHFAKCQKKRVAANAFSVAQAVVVALDVFMVKGQCMQCLSSITTYALIT